MPRSYCTCGHVADEHANGGQCRAQDDDGRCTCQSLDLNLRLARTRVGGRWPWVVHALIPDALIRFLDRQDA